jgi:hypothetical protein
MTVLKTITQRLFGRTVIDSLDLNQNAWYIDEEQVTATAANINGASILPATSQTVDVANDDVLFLDHSGSHAAAYDSIADVVTAITGDGLIANAGVIDTAYYGAQAIGSVRFSNAGNCDAVQVGAVLYTRSAVPVVTNGEWTEGAGAGPSAVNLAAAINGDTRNSGSSYYSAVVNADGDGVFILSKVAGGNAAIALTGAAPTEPSGLYALVGGVAKAARQNVMIQHTVTADEVAGTAHSVIPMPFVPAFFIGQVRTAAGEMKYITDSFILQATPNRISVVDNGAVHIAATDIITIFAQE